MAPNYPTKLRVQLYDPSDQHWWTLFGIQGDEFHLSRQLDRRELLALNGNSVPEGVVRRVSTKLLADSFKLTRAEIQSMLEFIA